MEVKVKTEVLFRLLKKAMSENRTYNNPSGNFIHLNDLNAGPIEPAPQMATQLSVAAPPVEDPDFIPSSMQELKAAAARISQEVPSDQTEFFYRSLHRLLDTTLDRHDSGLNESKKNLINLLSESLDFYNRKIEDIAAQFNEDPMFDMNDAVDDIMNSADVYGLDASLVDPLQIEDDIKTKAEELLSRNGTTGKLATSQTSNQPVRQAKKASEPTSDATETEEEDLPDITDDQADDMLSSIENISLDDAPMAGDKRNQYWGKVGTSVLKSMAAGKQALGHEDPIAIVAQVVFDSMRDVSREIGTQVAVGKYGFGGSEEETSSMDESAWSPILTNRINLNDEVIYKLSNKQSNVSFWQPKSYAFIKQFQQGTAGSLSSAVTAFNSLIDAGTQAAKKMFSDELTEENFLELVTYVVGTNIEKFANTRNVPESAGDFVDQRVDRAFGTIIKRGNQETNPLYFKDRRVFVARKPDPEDEIEIGGETKTLSQAFLDSIVADIAIVSVEYSIFKKALIPKDIEDETKRQKAISKITKTLSTSESLTFMIGKGSQRKTFSIPVQDVIGKAKSYIDAQFGLISRDEEDEDDIEIDSEIQDTAAERDPKSMDSAIAVMLDLYKSDQITPAAAVARDYVTFIINRKLKATGDEELSDDSPASAIFSVIDDSILTLSDPVLDMLETYIEEQKSVFESSDDIEVAKRVIAAANAMQDISALIEISDESGDTFGKIEYEDPETGESKTVNGTDVLNKTPGGAIMKYIYGNVLSDVFRSGKGGKFGPQIDSKKKINDIYKRYEKEMQSEVEALYQAEGVSLKDAQEAAYKTATQIGLKERSATFIKGNNVEPKASWVYQARVSKLPNFKAASADELNPITKNLVCWYSAIADKQSGGEASIQQKIQIAEEVYSELTNHADEWFDLNVFENFSRKGEFRSYVIDTLKKITGDKKALSSILSDAIDDYIKLVSLTPEKMKEMIKK